MRFFIIGFAFVAVVVVSVAGFRGDISRKPPIEVFPDMDRQPKLRPQEPNEFFANGKSSQLPVEGTIERSTPFANVDYPEIGGDVYKFDEVPVTTGRMLSSTNFVEINPFPITAEFIARGKERYSISCVPCHGPQANGKGVVSKFGMPTVADLHQQRIVEMPDGEIFNTITHGKSTMMGYAANIKVEDRWAIISYLRALQMTQLALEADLTEEELSNLNQPDEADE